MENQTTEPNSIGHILSTADGETAFFRSIIRYRPRGYNRHFLMLGICKDLEKELQVVIPSNQIWNTLRSCYNLDLLAEMEPDDPDEIDRSKSTIELLASKQTFFKEFQLPIHPTIPPEISFLELVNERRLDTSSNASSPDQPNRSLVNSPRGKRTTLNSSFKFHPDHRNNNKHQNENPSSDLPNLYKSTTDHRSGEEGMDSDLTEQEDYEDDEDNDGDEVNQREREKDEEEEEAESTPEPKIKKLKTSKQPNESNSTSTTHPNRLRNNNSNPPIHSSSSHNKSSMDTSNNLVRSNRPRNRTRSKK